MSRHVGRGKGHAVDLRARHGSEFYQVLGDAQTLGRHGAGQTTLSEVDRANPRHRSAQQSARFPCAPKKLK